MLPLKVLIMTRVACICNGNQRRIQKPLTLKNTWLINDSANWDKLTKNIVLIAETQQL
jgi:hypothetical protein